MEKKFSVKGFVFLVMTAVIWGFACVAQVLGADSMTPFYFNFSRYLLGTLSVIPMFMIFEKGATDKKKLKMTLIAGIPAGFALFAASMVQQIGFGLTDSAGKGGFITGLYMIIVPILGLFLGHKTGLSTWIGAGFGVVGLFMLCVGDSSFTFTLGDFLLILCAVFYAVHILIVDHFVQDIYSLRFSFVQYATSTVLNLICTLIFEEFALAPLQAALIPVLYCGIGSVGIAYTCQILGQKYSDPTSASVILSTESVFSAIGGALILNERFTTMGYVGCVLILIGILLTQIDFKAFKRRKRLSKSPSESI